MGRKKKSVKQVFTGYLAAFLKRKAGAQKQPDTGKAE
jgi:hypothetical protein